MNDEAINDAYKMFSQGGYSGSIDNFKQLISSNQNALNDSYEIFKRGGYSNDLASFKVLMGVGGSSTIKKKSPNGEYASGSGSSASPKLDVVLSESYKSEAKAAKEIARIKDLSNVAEQGSEILTGYPGKEKNKYEFRNGNWYEINPEVEKAIKKIQAEYEPKGGYANATSGGGGDTDDVAQSTLDAIKDIPRTRAIEDDNRIKALNKYFGKNASLSAVYDEYDNFFKDEQAGAVKSFIEKTDPTKRNLLGNKTTFDLGLGNVDNNAKYRIKDNAWERLTPNSPSYEKIESAPSIKALNARYGQNISVDIAPIVVKPKVIDPFLVINSNFLSKTEENAQTVLEKKFGDDFIFEQTGRGVDYIKVTPKNGADPMTFSFDEKSSDEAIRLQSFLRTNASFEKGSSLAEKTIKKNIVTAKDNDTDDALAVVNEKYYASDEYKNAFKELSYFQKKEEINRRQKEATVLRYSDIGGILGYFGASEKEDKKANISEKKAFENLYNSEEYELFYSEKTKFEQQQEERYSLLLDDYEIKRQRGDKEGARQAKLKIESGFSKYVIGDNLTNLSNSQYDLMSKKNDLIKSAEKLQERAENGLISEEEYNIGVEALTIEEARLKASAKEVSKTQKEMNALAGIYVAEKAKYGGFGSNFWNSFVIGTKEVGDMLISNSMSIEKAREEANKNRKSRILTPQQKKYYEDKGYSEQEIKNVLINKTELAAIKANKKAVIENIGSDLTTEESKAKLSFIENSLVGVAASVPSMALRAVPAVGAPLAFAGLANMSYNSIEEEMLKDPDFETTSKADRAVVAVPYALVMGALENYGLKKMTSGQAGVLGKFILSKAAKIIPPGSGRVVVEKIINSEVKNIFAKGGIKVFRGTLAEFETGLYQAAALDYGLKALYNELDPLDLKLTSEGGVTGGSLTGGELFDTPDTKAGVAMAILEGGAAEAIGGFAMSTVMVGTQGLINGKISLYNQDDLKFFEDFSSDEEFKKLIVSRLKYNMLDGTMTKGEAQAALNDIDLVAGIFNSIDENLPQGAKLEAFNLINEKRRLEKEVEGKDPALSKKSNDRIAEINAKLEELPSKVQEMNLAYRGADIEDALKQRKNKSNTVRINGKKVDRAEAEAELETIITKLEENAIQKQAASEVLVAEEGKAEEVKKAIENLDDTSWYEINRLKVPNYTKDYDDIVALNLPTEEYNKRVGKLNKQYEQEVDISIEEAYTKAKKDGSNPELVKAVEELLASVTQEVVQGEPTAEPQVITEEGKAQEVEYDEFTTEGINTTKKLLENSIEELKLKESKKSRLTRISEKLEGSVENKMIEQYQRELELLNADPLTFFKERVKKGRDSYQIYVDNFKIKEKAPATQESQKIKVEDIESKRIETEAKIKRKDLFSNGGSFSNTAGGSGVDSVPTGHSEINGIEFVQFSNPNTGEIDVVMTGKSDNDFVGFYRIYENGNATNKWSSKFENQSRNKEDFKTMIGGVQEMLPQGHEYTEKTSISTDGLRVWYQQLIRGYELQYDNKGKLITNKVNINGDSIVNDLGIAVNKGNFDNISVTNSSDMKKVKAALLPYLEKFGLNESNISFVNGTVEIDLPVLKKSGIKTETTTATQEVVSEEVAPQPENLTLRERMSLEAKGGKGKTTRVPKAPKVEAPVVEAPVVTAPVVVAPTINDIATEESEVNNVRTLGGRYYVPKKVYEEAYKNDTGNRGGQTVDDIISRGGYSVRELDNLLPNWKELTVELNKPQAAPVAEAKVVQENKPRKSGYKNTIVKKEESATESGVAEYKTYAVDENGNERLMRTSGGIRTTVGELAPASQNSSLFYAADENGDFTILKLDPNTRVLITRTSEGNDSRGNYEQRTSVRLIDGAFDEGDIEAEFLTTKDIFSTPIYKTNTTTTEAKGTPTNFSWPKIKEYTSEVIRSMRQAQFAKLNLLRELKRPSAKEIIKIKDLEAKIKSADAVLNARENKIKEDEKKAEKGEVTDKSPRVNGVDQNSKSAEFGVVVNEKKQTAQVQLKKRGGLELARQKPETDLKIQTDDKGRRFVETQNKSRVYIDEKVTPPKTKVKAAPVTEVKAEPVVEPKAEPVKKSTVTAEDTMGIINTIKEEIEEIIQEIKDIKKEPQEQINEIEGKIIDTKNEAKIEDYNDDITIIKNDLKEALEDPEERLAAKFEELKKEVGSLKDLDIKKPENKKTLLSYIDGAIATLNSLNKLTYAKLDAGVTLGTLKLILQGIRAGVVAGKGFNTAVRAMATKYKNEHKNEKITIAEFIKEINDYLDSTYVDPQTYKESLEEEIDKFAEIKEAVRQARAALKSQSKELRAKAATTIKTMLKGKVKDVSAVQMKSIMTRLSSFNVFNQTQYDKFLDYVDKVIEIANYDTKVKEANAKRKKAKDNTIGKNPKLGDLSLDLLGSLSRMLNINAKLISKEVFDSYYDIVDDLSKRTTILSPGERADLNIKVNEIVDSIEQNEEMLPDLKDAYDNFANKVVENGVVNYAKTLTQMLEDGVINNKEFALMKKYKSKIVDAKVKVKMTPAEEAAEKAELINEITNTAITLDAIVGDEFRLERELAKRLARLINKESLENLENKELKDLLKIIDNINNGFVSKSTQQMVEKLNETQKSPLLVKSIPKSVKGIFKKISQPFTGIFTRDKYGTNITPLFNIDEVFGDFKNKNIFNSIFEQSAVSQQQYQSEVSEIQGKLVKAESDIASSFNRNENKVVLSKFKMMVYMMQLEYNSNPNSQKGDKRQVHQAMKTLDATIKFAETNRKKSRYTKEDIAQMKAIKEEFEKNDGFEEDGKTIKKIIDIDKLYNSFNEAEKNALKVFDEVNSLMTKKATYTATVINGNKIVPLKNYIYYNTISDPSTSAEQATNLINNINNNMKPGTESKNLQERTGNVSPVNLDPFFAVNSSAKSVLINYHMTEPIRTARKTLSNARKILEKNKEEKIDVGEQFEILSVIEEAYDTATKDLLETNFSESSNLKSVAQYLTKAGYRAMLGSVTRASAELVSNAAFVTINNPKDMAAGFKYRGIANSGRGKNILTNLKSKVISRNYPQGGLSSNYVDLSSFTDRTTRDGKSRTKYVNGVKQVFDYTAGTWVNFVETVADNLISRPDQIVMKQLYFGAFSREFEKETGVEPDFEKIEANDEEYMDKYKDALEKAKNEADNQTVTAGSSMNAYMGTLQNVVRKGDSGAKAGLKTFNQFMNRFTIQEYITARKGVNAAIGRGDVTPAEGRQVLAAVATRMTLYLTLGKVFSQALMYLSGAIFGYGDDDDDDEKTLLQTLYQSAVSSATTLFFGRNYGNVVRSAENYFIEWGNELYGEDIGLRNKEYDPFKDALQYNQFGKVDELSDFAAIMAGPLAPVINAGTFAIKFKNKEAPEGDRAIETRRKEWYRLGIEAAGSVGLVPFYRDVRKVTMDWVYDELKKEQKEKAAKKEITEAEDASTLETKTNTLNRMRDIYKDGRSRSIIDDELRKLTDPDFKKQEKDKEDAEEKRLLDKYGYDTQGDFERNDNEKYKKVFGNDSPYRRKLAPKAKILKELKDRINADKDNETYKSTGSSSTPLTPEEEYNKRVKESLGNKEYNKKIKKSSKDRGGSYGGSGFGGSGYGGSGYGGSGYGGSGY